MPAGQTGRASKTALCPVERESDGGLIPTEERAGVVEERVIRDVPVTFFPFQVAVTVSSTWPGDFPATKLVVGPRVVLRFPKELLTFQR